MDRSNRCAFAFALLAAWLLAAPPRVAACDCDRGAPCQAFYEASAVFVGKVESISRGSGGDLVSRHVHFEVVESLRGAAAQLLDIDTGWGGTDDCAYPFKVGETYLVYAQPVPDGSRLRTDLCTRTKRLQDAADDLRIARAAPGAPARGGVIFGTAANFDRTLVTREQRGPDSYPAAAGVVIDAHCENFDGRGQTDARGRYAIPGLPVGACSIKVTPPDGMYVFGPPKDVVVPDLRWCREVPVAVASDGRIRGRIVDADLRPLAGVTVDAIMPSQRWLLMLQAVTTDADGLYELVRLPPGDYAVGINAREPARGARPAGRAAYFPAMSNLADAAMIAVSAGERVALPDFTLPESVAFVHASGTVVDEKGTPVVGARILLRDSSTLQTLSGRLLTDDQGRFNVAIPRGMRAALKAEWLRPLPERPGNIDGGAIAPFVASADRSNIRIVVQTPRR